jgi:16S rRNA (adenine1518-N6/adenine1519-N6)-dimethyltransferase
MTFLHKKSLGQHFLKDDQVIDMIIQSCEPLGEWVLEIGPGPLTLTKPLLQKVSQGVIVIEKDDRFQKSYEIPGLFPIFCDASSIRIKDIKKQFNINGKIKIVSNLPYNIGTRLLLNWLNELDEIESMVLMFQKEVVDRIVAKPGTSDYGRLSVVCGYLCDCIKLFDVKAESFSPPPNVDSSVVKIIPKINCSRDILKDLQRITQTLFAKRRKMIRTSSLDFPDDIDISKRPQDLTIDDILNITKKNINNL